MAPALYRRCPPKFMTLPDRQQKTTVDKCSIAQADEAKQTKKEKSL